MTTIEIIVAIFVALIALWIATEALKKIRRAFIVPEGYAGLLYRKGKFAELLGPGRHVRWGQFLTLEPSDLRKAYLAIAGQEVLTADNVGLKLSLFVTYQVTDPVKAAHETQNWHGDIYNVAQVALRAVIAATPVEGLLGNRLDITAQLLARVQPETAKIGVSVHAVEVKDVMFSGELKRAFADVLKAKQEGQAALERARGESAALRNLANAARVLDVSGSMAGSFIAGSCLTAREGSAAMALITAATESNCEIVAFSAAKGGFGGQWGGGESGITPIDISPRMRLSDVIKRIEAIPMGGTDCALPMIWARRNRVNVSGFVTYTDSETWAGNIHPAQALRQYRSEFVGDAKAVVVGMTSNGFTLADPNDRGMLDVVGFDASAPAVIADFIRS